MGTGFAVVETCDLSMGGGLHFEEGKFLGEFGKDQVDDCEGNVSWEGSLKFKSQTFFSVIGHAVVPLKSASGFLPLADGVHVVEGDQIFEGNDA